MAKVNWLMIKKTVVKVGAEYVRYADGLVNFVSLVGDDKLTILAKKLHSYHTGNLQSELAYTVCSYYAQRLVDIVDIYDDQYLKGRVTNADIVSFCWGFLNPFNEFESAYNCSRDLAELERAIRAKQKLTNEQKALLSNCKKTVRQYQDNLRYVNAWENRMFHYDVYHETCGKGFNTNSTIYELLGNEPYPAFEARKTILEEMKL